MAEDSGSNVLHERYDWLDQARGLVVLMLIVSMSTSEFAGDLIVGEVSLGPPMWNHGYDYFDSVPAIITFIDIGQALFVFMMGFVGYIAFTSRIAKRGKRSGFLYALRRVGLLYALAGLDSVLLSLLANGRIEWDSFLYKGTFSSLALGALTAFVGIVLCPKPDRRIVIAIAMTALHAVLYAFPIFDHRGWQDDMLRMPAFPFGALGMCSVALAGSCFGQWYATNPDEPLQGFRARIVPASLLASLAAYSMDWMQPAQHHDATAALQLYAIACGGLMLMIFYAFGVVGFRIPLLSTLGKNLLLMFAVGGLGASIYLNLVPRSLLMQSPVLTLLLGAIIPFVGLSLFARFLEKRGIMVRA